MERPPTTLAERMKLIELCGLPERTHIEKTKAASAVPSCAPRCAAVPKNHPRIADGVPQGKMLVEETIAMS